MGSASEVDTANRIMFDSKTVGPFEVPEPMLTSVGENNKRCPQVLRIASGLFFSVVWVAVLTLGLEHAQHPPKAVFEKIIHSPVRGMELKLNLLRIKQVPSAVFQRLVD